MHIIPYTVDNHDAIIRLSLRAWEPVFASLQTVMDPEVFLHLHPDWHVGQHKAVEEVCAAADTHVWVARDTAAIVGFVAVQLHLEAYLGEIAMLAVAPESQGRGIGTALTEFAVNWCKEVGMVVVMVETGGDAGHAPARHTYEKIGFKQMPIARYFKKL